MGYPEIRDAEVEVAQISEQLRHAGMNDSALTCLVGLKATEERYRTNARDADLVHLAAHARIGQSALASTLFLAPGASSDGVLTAAELAKIRLDDAIVVLSACDSAQGRPTAEGLLGLTRGLLEAGARVVVASLWKVSDPVAPRFMSYVYENLLNAPSPLDLMHALQTASMRTRDDLARGRIRDRQGLALDDRSAHWAPFVVIGDMRSIQFSREE